MPDLVPGRTKEHRFMVDMCIAEQILEDPEITTKNCGKAVREKLGEEFDWVTTQYVRVNAKWKNPGSRVQIFVRNLKLVTKEDHIEMLSTVQRRLARDIYLRPEQLDTIRPKDKVLLLELLSKVVLTYTGQHRDFDAEAFEVQKQLLRLIHSGARGLRELESLAAYDRTDYIDGDGNAEPSAGSAEASSVTRPRELHAVAVRIPGASAPAEVDGGR